MKHCASIDLVASLFIAVDSGTDAHRSLVCDGLAIGSVRLLKIGSSVLSDQGSRDASHERLEFTKKPWEFTHLQEAP